MIGQYPGPHYVDGEGRHKKLIWLITSRLFFTAMIGQNKNSSWSISNTLNRSSSCKKMKNMHDSSKYAPYSVQIQNVCTARCYILKNNSHFETVDWSTNGIGFAVIYMWEMLGCLSRQSYKQVTFLKSSKII